MSWEFACPQFCDFAEENIEASPGDLFFERNVAAVSTPDSTSSDLKPSTSDESHALRTDDTDCAKFGNITQETEKKLLEKVDSAFNVILCTPGLKAAIKRTKLLSELPLKKHSVKPSNELRRSISAEAINRARKQKVSKSVGFGLRRTSSLTDIRGGKKRTYPVTPMCLKRTLKAKSKVTKTSEDIELEEIARLRKETFLHLRQNELYLKKLNLKPKSSVLNMWRLDAVEHVKEKKDAVQASVKSMVRENSMRRDLLKAQLQNRANILNKINGNVENQQQNLDRPTTSGAQVTSKLPLQNDVLKSCNAKKYAYHSGIKFNSLKLNSAKLPRAETKSPEDKMKHKNWDSASRMKKVIDGKENMPHAELPASPAKTAKKILNSKFVHVQPTDSVKRNIERRIANFARNFALNEKEANK